jgi:RNA polymerase sigma-70 factor (ECF subfamily)
MTVGRGPAHGAARSGWPPTLDDIVAARDGDRRVLGAILTLGYPKLVAFYRGMGLTSAEAEDLAGEAVEGMVRNMHRLREPAAFEGWFWTVARNRVRSAIRRKGRIEQELEYAPVDDPADLAVARSEHTVIRSAFERLTVKDREILWLREVEELSYEEIGGRLAMATGAVRVAALRARRRLEEVYGGLHPDTP